MLAVSAWALQQVMQEQRGPHSGIVHALFEWPKAAYEQAANLPELVRIQRLLGYDCRFDVCMYALTDAAGTPMRKPWQALTSLACLRKPLSRECNQLHDHAVTRGRAAIRSARYTAQLVEAVGRAVLAYPMRSGEAEEVGAPVRALNDESGSGSSVLVSLPKSLPGKSERQGLPESDAGKSVRRGFPKPDPSGIATTTPPVSVTKPPGRAVGANDPGEIPAEIQADRDEERARAAKTLPTHEAPSAELRARHEITHLLFAPWCAECIRGRGRDVSHQKVTSHDGPPAVELDYSFVRSGVRGDALVTLLLAMRKEVGYGLAGHVRSTAVERADGPECGHSLAAVDARSRIERLDPFAHRWRASHSGSGSGNCRSQKSSGDFGGDYAAVFVIVPWGVWALLGDHCRSSPHAAACT